MKKLLLGICLSLSLLVAGGAWGIALNSQPVYAETENTNTELVESEESNYFRDKVMPYIVANASSICSAIIVVIASLSKIKAATAELKTSNTINGQLKDDNNKLRSDIKELKDEVQSLKDELAEVKDNTNKTKEMVKIGFCNTQELVTNGYASKIAEVADEKEKTDA